VTLMSRTHEDIQDELLVLRCQDGDREALKTLIARWQPRLGRLAWRLTGQREVGQDIVQDTWLAIVRGIRRLDDPARFRSWAYRIVSNKCADWTRRRVVQRNAVNDLQNAAASSTGGSSDDTDSSDEVARMRDALSKLPDEQRVVLSLHYLDGMSVAEIARTLDVPAGTVKSRLYHARNRLKQTLERIES
jgi:RNA polymerase sigma-70 factor (ECF subfamily)